MKRFLTIIAIVVFTTLLSLVPSAIAIPFGFYDGFDGSEVNINNWHIPTWVSPTDGTYIGRTQFRVSQNSTLPSVGESNVAITVQSYNPTGFSFYGTDLISNQSFLPQEGFTVTVRAKIDAPVQPGIVGGIFLYAIKPGSNTLHDEIDFELLGNKPNQFQTNIYNNEPLGVGHPIITTYSSGTISDYHTYQITWTPTYVSWSVDGKIIRTEKSNVPVGPMYLHLNLWVPDTDWPAAYSAVIQPTSLLSENLIYTMSVDSVDVTTGPTKTPPTLILDPVMINGSNVTISGQAKATTPAATIDKINVDWGEGAGFVEYNIFPVTYLYQNSGEYLISVKVCDSNGLWSENATVKVVLSPTTEVATETKLNGPKSLKVRSLLKLTGIVTPLSAPGKVTIIMERLIGLKWQSAGSVSSNLLAGKFFYTFKPTKKGKWRFTANYTGGKVDSTTYLASTSMVKSVLVK